MDKAKEGLSIITDIIKNVVSEMSSGKDKIFQIVDNLRDEYESKKLELEKIKSDLENTIIEVDTLERLDKTMRLRLVESSKNTTEDESVLKRVYESAVDIRVKYLTKQNEEKELRNRRNTIELALKQQLENIEEADKLVKQVNVALSYLQGDILKAISNMTEFSHHEVGIKILEAQEKERTKVAREIHDGPAQYMANTMINIDYCKLVIQKDLNEGLNQLDELKGNVRLALKEIRGILFDLRPPALGEQGLDSAINEMINNLINETDINVQVSIDKITDNIEEIIQIGIYRVIQEILNNIRKHAKAKNINVRLMVAEKWIYFVIEDDGVGFNFEEKLEQARQKGKSYGLLGIINRIEDLKGDIKVISEIDIGTKYIGKIER